MLREWFAAQNVLVHDVRIAVNPATGASRGFAFAEIARDALGSDARSSLQESPLDGCFPQLEPFEATCSPARLEGGITGMRVLVVDDDPQLRTTIAALLDMQGATASTAESGNAGFHALVREKPDVLLSDLRMPDGSGYDLIQRLRGLQPDEGGLTPGIAMSGTETARDAMMAGFHVFIPKPFDVVELMDTVSDFRRCEPRPEGAPTAIVVTSEGELLITLTGRVESRDVAAIAKPLLTYLEQGPHAIALDLRFVTSFSPSVAATAEVSLWTHRHRIRSAQMLGGSFAARLVCAAACRTLGIPCTFVESVGTAPRAEP
jgi:DNA-binding response OmpR family regulator